MAQQRFQGHKLTKGHQVMFVIAIGCRVAVRLFLAKHDHAVEELRTLLRSTSVHDTGDQAAVLGAHQIVHHGKETVLIALYIGNGGLRPDDDRHFAHQRTALIQIGLQRTEQRLRSHFIDCSILPCTMATFTALSGCGVNQWIWRSGHGSNSMAIAMTAG